MARPSGDAGRAQIHPQRVGCFPNPISDSARHPSPGKRLQSDAQLDGKACETSQTCISGSEHPSVEIREYERNQHPSPSRGQATPFPNGRVPSSPYLAVSQAPGWPRPGRRISTKVRGMGMGEHGIATTPQFIKVQLSLAFLASSRLAPISPHRPRLLT